MTSYYIVGIPSGVWGLSALLLFVNWFVKSIPSWLVDIANFIFIWGLIIGLCFAGFILFVMWLGSR